MMKRFSILLLLLLFTVLNFVWTTENNFYDVFKKATELYKEKKFNEAVIEYNKLINSGIESSEVYYNLGNSYYRLGKTAEPIFFYEKALKLSPNDEDIINNLRIANLRTVDKYDEFPKFFLTRWFEDIRDSRTSDSWLVVGIIFLWIGFIFLALFLFVWNVRLKKIIFAAGTLAVLLFIFSFVFGIFKSNFENNNKVAVIFSASSYVKSSPDRDGTDLFILHEGAKVKVLENVGEWNRIKLPNGKTGWLISSEVKII